VEWEASEVRFFVDDELYARRTPAAIPAGATWAFDNHPFFVILNLAVGGILPGSPDDTTTFPEDLVVDYVRVYRR
jgi:beta-glucanase (GH16 family)